jgi:hypothetical protein
LPRGFTAPGWGGTSFGAFRLPTDPLFFADLTLQNVVAGSRYRITRTSTGAELATGVAAGSGLIDVVVAGLPVFSNPMQVSITVRNASGSPPYKVFDTQASMTRDGVSAFISQIED